jgi:hypothetical protein
VKRKTIRAAEISEFVFCQRAWWHSRQGTESAGIAGMFAGQRWHHEHGRQVLAAGCLRVVGFALMAAAAILAVAHWVSLALE